MAMILDEEQTMLRDSAREFCQAQAPISQLRALRDNRDADGFDRSTWASMVELGWAGIPFPERCGGLDFGWKGLGVVTEETGRTLTASPLFASVWLAGACVLRGGSDEQRQALLAGVAGGSHLLALALEEGSRHAPHQVATTAETAGDGFVLNGRKTFVLDGHVADTFVVVARTGGASGTAQGLTLFVVPADSPGLAVTRTWPADSRNAANLVLSGVQVGRDAVLGEVDQGAAVLDPALDTARVGLAAEMLGAAEEAFQRTLAYLKEREQFGQVIGSFQALKHRAADMFCELELTRSVVLEALTALDEGRDAAAVAELASLAKARAGETFDLVSREAVQMHGGIGMTDEFDIGFFMKRRAVADQLLGDAVFHRNRYAALQGY